MLCYFQRISSTQDELLQLLDIHPDLPDGIGLVADWQSHGHGRGNKMWQAHRGQNALFSFVHRPGIAAGDAYLLNQAAAAAVALSLRDENIDAVIKWPNDILTGGHKMAGVLVNTRLEREKLRLAVVGIGLNVNQTDFPDGLKATSVKLISGRESRPLDWPHRIIERYFELWKQGAAHIRRTYFELWKFAGTKRRIGTHDGRDFSGWQAADIRNGKIHIFMDENKPPVLISLENLKYID